MKAGCLLAALIVSTIAFAADSYRLPTNVVPLEYDVQLTIDPAKQGFEGSVAVLADVKASTDTIHLHAVELDIASAKVDGQIAALETGGTEMVALRLPRPIDPGRVRIELQYRANYDVKGSRGIFKQTLGADAFVFSHFEPTDARRAFPCFDEPQFKTPWTITLRTPDSVRSFSNAPELKVSAEAGGMRVVRFRSTKPLPSYLVAFAVGPFDVVEVGKVGRKRTPVRTIVPRGDGPSTAMANADTMKIVPALENYFNSAYPFEKLDQIAIPHTVSFSAMEHPGLISYTRGLLVSQDAGFVQREQRVTTLAHELAHQWFGNLVTHRWWDDIWLNEALASWAERKIASVVAPELQSEIAAIRAKSVSMRSDSLDSARKIRQPVNDRNEVGAAFDTITYEKGSAVISMFENYMGEEAFRRGLQRYMARHRWGSVTNTDFVAAISEASGKNLAPLFSSFLDQPGLPLFRMELECGNGAPKVRVTQERLVPLGSKAERNKTWQAPLCLRYGAGAQCEVLRDPRQEILLKTKACPDWVLGNAGAAGYYSVLYSPEMSAALTRNATHLSVAERVDAVVNALALTRASHMSAGDALALTTRFATESEPAIGVPALSLIQELRQFVLPEFLPVFDRYVADAFWVKLRELGMTPKPGEPKETVALRMNMLLVVGLGSRAELNQSVNAIVQRWLADRTSVSVDAAYPMLALYSAWAGDAEFTLLRKAFLESKDPSHKQMLAAAMTYMNGPAADSGPRLLLDPAFDIRELRGMFYMSFSRPEIGTRWWNFVRSNYDALVRRLPSQAQRDLITVTRHLCSDQDATDVRQFFGSKVGAIEGGPRALDQAEEAIRLCAARRAKQRPEIEAFLKAQR
jgi:alanyl aminopeptidase